MLKSLRGRRCRPFRARCFTPRLSPGLTPLGCACAGPLGVGRVRIASLRRRSGPALQIDVYNRIPHD